MNKIKSISILMVLSLIIFSIFNKCIAQSEMILTVNKDAIEKEEEITLKVEIKNTEIAAGTIQIYWNMEKLEYIEGPDNSNYSNNRILYTWVSNNAKNETTIQIGDFVFKGLEDGNANIVVTGDFYNENGEEININNNNLQIKIGKKEAEVEQLSQEQTNVSSDNTNLSILRLDKEGISPYFKKEVKEYYFIADETIDNLEVTAIPENKNATVTITGNKNLKIGRNTININIISEDKSKEETYKIYVTKTDDIEKANANLENLAVRSVDLYPEFDYNITQYEIEIANEVNKIDILAVPQNEKANVTIIGNDEMKVGDNIVQINVLAEDGITNKKYELAVHRRNEEEELLHQQEEELQIERLSSILQEQEENNIEDEKAESQKRIIKWIIIIVPISIIVVIVIIIIYKKIKNKIRNPYK